MQFTSFTGLFIKTIFQKRKTTTHIIGCSYLSIVGYETMVTAIIYFSVVVVIVLFEMIKKKTYNWNSFFRIHFAQSLIMIKEEFSTKLP